VSRIDDIIADFEFIDDWEERYRYIIELGRTLEPLPEADHTDEHKVRGCASQVWLVTEPSDDGRLVFRGDSDAVIVQGLVAVMLRLYSGRTTDEILGFDAAAALKQLGLVGALSAQRSNGLASMVQRIRKDAANAPLTTQG
jgi:cysteine desulfuration protein SufE